MIQQHDFYLSCRVFRFIETRDLMIYGNYLKVYLEVAKKVRNTTLPILISNIKSIST